MGVFDWGYRQKTTLLEPAMPLTDTAIKKAKPGAKPVKLSDGRGLYLLVSPAGATLEGAPPTAVVRATLDTVFHILDDQQLKVPGQLSHRRRLLEEVIAGRLGLTAEEYGRLVNGRDQWWTPAEALAAHAVDEVVYVRVVPAEPPADPGIGA